jgi:hypothetical protein
VVVVPDADQLLVRLDRIQMLIDQLAKARGDFAKQQDLAERLRREIVAAKVSVMPYGAHDII